MITEAVGGCGYVSFSWTDNSSEICHYIYYVNLEYSMRRALVTPSTQFTSTELPYDTQFDFTIYAALSSDVTTATSNQDHASVRTLPVEGMYVCMCIYIHYVCTYIYLYIHIHMLTYVCTYACTINWYIYHICMYTRSCMHIKTSDSYNGWIKILDGIMQRIVIKLAHTTYN